VDPIFAIATFLFGLAFGSFLNVCIHRMPLRIHARDEREHLEEQLRLNPEAGGELKAEIERLRREQKTLSIAQGRSACPGCHQPIAAYDNIPVISWLLLRGRCRRCGVRISSRYIAVELLCGLLFVACYVRFGLTLSSFKYCTLSFLLLGLIFTDAEWKLLPDALTLPGLAIGLLFSLFVPVNDLAVRILSSLLPPGLVNGALGNAGSPVVMSHGTALSWRVVSLGQAALGAAVGASFIYGVGVLYLRARGVEGMGLGDVKLMAMVGAFLGVTLTVFTLFAASFVGTLFGLGLIASVGLQRTRRRLRRTREGVGLALLRGWKSATLVYRHVQIPFGVFLGGMALLAAFFGNVLLRWYWERFL
jgi:leader peptidase (prepilin peptidase) / N-methyltransferase